jgi:hypothetical protein
VIAAELGPEFVGVGALQLLEYSQRLLPGVPGPGPVAGCLAGVAEMVECLGLSVALAELAEDTEGPVVAGCRFVVLPEVVVGAAEALAKTRCRSGVLGRVICHLREDSGSWSSSVYAPPLTTIFPAWSVIAIHSPTSCPLMAIIRTSFAYKNNPLKEVHLSAPFEKIFRSITGELCAAQRAADGELLDAHLIGPEVTELLPELTLRPRRIG